MTPQVIAKAVIQEMITQDKDVMFAKGRMIDLWEDAFPIIAYVDDAASLKAKKTQAKKSAPRKVSPTEGLRAEISFNELWGADINDNKAFAGLAMEAASVDSEGLTVKPVELHGHLAEGLTRTQLARTGFKEHGGLVITMLNPMIDDRETRLSLGSHLYFRAQKYRISEKVEIVKWDLLKGNLYTVINCVL